MDSLLCFKSKKKNKKQPQNGGCNKKSTQEEKGLPTPTAGMKTLSSNASSKDTGYSTALSGIGSNSNTRTKTNYHDDSSIPTIDSDYNQHNSNFSLSDAGGTIAIIADTDANLFASLPDTTWEMISSYAAPPDVYNLSLSSKHFFREVSTDKPSAKKTPSANAAAKGNAASSSNDKKVLATQLLRSSLLSSLGRVLEKSGSGITLDAVLKMGELPEGSALIAGSTIVAACLGKDWSGGRNSSDVDVYCSARAAPQVRSWLVEQANCIFNGVNDGYIDFVDNRLLYAIDTKIHHVEAWGSFAEHLREYSGGLGESEYRQRTTQWGKGASNYAIWKWMNTMSFPELGLSTDRLYDIKPKPRGGLPFDFNGYGGIDLIVAQDGLIASDLLNGFDLEICKASFDGKKFHIPDPHLTFAAKTKMETNRRAVVGSYVAHYQVPENQYFGAIEFSRNASTTISAVRRDVPNTPFYKRLDLANMLPDLYNPNARMFDHHGTFQDPMVKMKHGASIQFHNWCCKLIDRLRKYQQRGIEVVDAPTIAANFRTDQFSIIAHEMM